MSPEAETILELASWHRRAAKDVDEERRVRLFRLLDDFEWAYPDAADEVRRMYPTTKPAESE